MRRLVVSQFEFLCATSVFSVTLWLLYLQFLQPQRHREHRGYTEKKFKLRHYPKVVPLVLLLLCTSVASAQTREEEWKSIALPQTNFTRQINAEKQFVFRVPADWKKEDE